MRGEEIQPQLQITRVLTGSPLQTQEIRPGKKKSLGAFGNERGAIADVLHAFLVLKYYVFLYQTFLIFHFGGTE